MDTTVNERIAERKPLKAEVDPVLRKRIKIRAAEEGVTMREYVSRILERGLDEEEALEAGEKNGR